MEEEIAAKLKQSVPVSESNISVSEPDVMTDEQSSALHEGLDELTLMKMHNFFGLDYSQVDDKTNARMKFVWEEATKLSGSNAPEDVMSEIGSLLNRIGQRHSPGKFMKLYLWLKLNQESTAIQAEMQRIENER